MKVNFLKVSSKVKPKYLDKFIFIQIQKLFKKWFCHVKWASSQTNNFEWLKIVSCSHHQHEATFYMK